MLSIYVLIFWPQLWIQTFKFVGGQLISIVFLTKKYIEYNADI